MTWFLLVPGACHGGWWFEPMAELLRQEGHTADAVTLRGLNPHAPSLIEAINLDTHVNQVLQLLVERSEPVVLVGHSYAGSVITAVADQRPDQVTGLLYLDAFVPKDGDSCWSMTNDEQREWYSTGSGETGLGVQPMPFFDQRTRPHPLASFMQQSKLTGAYEGVNRKHYVLATATSWVPHSPFASVAERLRSDPSWTVRELDITHNVLAQGPGEILQQILELA